jgi:hypothetical protein
MMTAMLTRCARNVIPRAETVLCTLSDGTRVAVPWRSFVTMLGDDLVTTATSEFEVRRVPSDQELAALMGAKTV